MLKNLVTRQTRIPIYNERQKKIERVNFFNKYSVALSLLRFRLLYFSDLIYVVFNFILLRHAELETLYCTKILAVDKLSTNCDISARNLSKLIIILIILFITSWHKIRGFCSKKTQRLLSVMFF